MSRATHRKPVILEIVGGSRAVGMESVSLPPLVGDLGKLGLHLLLLTTDTLAHHGRLSRIDRQWADLHFQVPSGVTGRRRES
jgi:hypothetical protein